MTTSRLAEQDWIDGLREERADAVDALRLRIRTGLSAALSNRSDVDDADLEDFTQDAAIRVLRRLDSFRGDSKFATWAMAVAVRVSLTELRRRRWANRSLDDLPLTRLDPVAPQSERSVRSDRAELFAELRRAIAEELTARQREVLLAELRGVPQIVLARHLGLKPGAIYKTSHDARRKIKSALVGAGYEAATVREILHA